MDEEIELEDGSDEELVPEEEVVNPAAQIKKLRAKLKICQTERQEYLDASQRLRADYLNYRKEAESGQAEMFKFAKADLLTQLLELADNFELAMANKESWEAVDENWRQGIMHIYAKLGDIFKQNGLEVIGDVDVSFNPVIHQAVEMAGGVNESDIVVEVVQKGYRLNGKVIRPARVKVGQ
ncbi:MAG: nucleotide exchange factor GrpE [Patescibacteria group bacterium]|nr:nucleotide exchange factor GrpE [Patescibacteria group bacterium]